MDDGGELFSIKSVFLKILSVLCRRLRAYCKFQILKNHCKRCWKTGASYFQTDNYC